MILYTTCYFLGNQELKIRKLNRRKYKMYRDNRGPPREMHKVTCAECGQEAEVPFKPDGTRPVYCRECYRKKKPRRF